MAIAQIKAGVSFDFATPKEVADIVQRALNAAALEYGRGKTFKNFSATATVASSAVKLGDPGSATDRLAPDDGFVWSVKRLVVVGLAVNDVIGVYRNSTNPMDAVESGAATAGTPWPFFGWGSRQFVLKSDESLVVANVGNLTATGSIYIAGMAEEVPSNMSWLL